MKEKRKISAKIVADSKDSRGNRITTFLLTYPRFLQPEVLTHRMFSRNAASSRAIPFKKMVQSVKDDPFIPIAFQKDHKGMQGTEYLDLDAKYKLSDFLEILTELVGDGSQGILDNLVIDAELEDSRTLIEWWLYCRDLSIQSAIILHAFGVTKQLANRVLEPFLWYTNLVTATEYDNFFELRCPQYSNGGGPTFKSWKDLAKWWYGKDNPHSFDLGAETTLDKIKCSKSHAEIHIQTLAEAMWDARNESAPKTLSVGEWHIPFGDKMDKDVLMDLADDLAGGCDTDPNEYIDQLESKVPELKMKVATARCARLSYETHDGEIDYEKDIKLHDRLLERKHASCFEHCAKAMSDEEYASYSVITPTGDDKGLEHHGGWCRNFRGFIPYRHIVNL